MKYLILDVETTVHNQGNPFDVANKLCIISYATADESGWVKVEYDDEPYSKALEFIQRLVDGADIIVGFNLKFDLHWLRRYGIKFRGKRIWDCQLVHFMLDYQRNAFPALDDVCKSNGLAGKSGDVVRGFWDGGANTDEIPLKVLTDYGVNDAEITRALYLCQYQRVAERGRKFVSLVALHNADELVTQEMEWNGLLLDTAACLSKADDVQREIGDCNRQLNAFFGVDWVNYDSPKQLSTLLFGGSICKEWKEEVGTYKTGNKIGQPRYKWKEEKYDFQGVVKPLKGTELADGGFSTAEDHLRGIRTGGKSTRIVLDLLIRRAELEKLRSSYYEGLPKILSTMGWEGSYLHGQINHCVVRTGRTSSSKPNLQNIPPEVDTLFRSRFGDDGLVVAFDAKGLEWVCIAFQSQDPVAMQEIKDGVDQHAMNQERFGLPEKRVAKYFVFRLIYGGMARTFTKDPDFNWVSDREPFWQDVMDKFYDKYNGIGVTHTAWFKSAVETGKFTSPTGREFIYTPKHGEWQWTRPVILNYPVQSLGADLMAIARVSLFKRMQAAGLRSLLVNTVHDSIVLDICKKEWYAIQQMVKEVFDDIPKNFEKLFAEPFNLPMRAEAKQLNGEEITI